MTFRRWSRLETSAMLAVLLGACAHSASTAHVLPPLAPASASMVLVEARQQVIHGHPCPDGFLQSELPGDWCYRIGEVVIGPADIETKAVIHNTNSMRWEIEMDLRPAGARRFDAFSIEHAGQDGAIVAGATVLAVIPLPKIERFSTSHWTLNEAWTEQQTRRIERSLGGDDITNSLVPITQCIDATDRKIADSPVHLECR
jgi:hypothetical protein